MVDTMMAVAFSLVTMSVIIVGVNLILCAFTEEEREQSDEQ